MPSMPAVPAALALGFVGVFGDPGLEAWGNQGVEDRRRAFPPVLPREIAVPVAPQRIGRFGFAAGAREGKITHRHHPWSLTRFHQMPPAIAEGVELLGVIEIQISLLAHPGPQAALQRAVRLRIEGTEGKGVFRAFVMHHQHARALVRDGDDRRRKADADNVLGGV